MDNHPNSVGVQTTIKRVSFDIVVENLEGTATISYLRGEGLIEVPYFNMSYGDLIDYADEILTDFFALKYNAKPGTLWYSDGVDCPIFERYENGRINFGMLN